MRGSQVRLHGSLPILASTIILIAATIGCGSSPEGTSVTQTQHPLVAQYNIMLDGPAQVWVEFGPDTNYGRQTSQSAAGSGLTTLHILVAGMNPSSTYHMRAHAQWASGATWVDQDRTFTTGAVAMTPAASPNGSAGTLPVITVNHSAPLGTSPAPGVELLSFGANSPVATDLNGNILWYCNTPAVPIKPLSNGHFFVNTGTDLQEVDLTCKVLRDVSYTQVNQSLQANGYDFTIPAPLGQAGGNPFHHDMLALPNGHWIGLCEIAKNFDNLTGYSGTTQVVGDALVDIDPNGNVVWAWSAFDHLDPNRHPYFGLPDWTHSNALVYTADGNLLLSMRAQSWILKIDYANGKGTGDILWTLGEGGSFTLAGGDPSQWFYSQHYPNLLTTNGSLTTLAVYDDGNFRTYSDGSVCGPPPAPACFSRATIFQVDESTQLATLLWQDTPGFFCVWGGSVGVLSNGNVEFDNTDVITTNSSQIVEVTPGSNPQVVWQMDISGGAFAYRGMRIPSLYPGVTWTK